MHVLWISYSIAILTRTRCLILYRHSHGGCDQIFSIISGRLSVVACLTLEKFIHEVQTCMKPKPAMILLKRSLNFHEWLSGALAKYHSSISQPRQFIFSKTNNGLSTPDGVQTMVRCSEWSHSPLGEPMFPLQRLPNGKPRYNANRPIFSKWETATKRTSVENSEEIFKKAEAQIFGSIGDLHEMSFSFQRDAWKSLIKKLRKWEKLEAKDYDAWWPQSRQDVTLWISSIPQLSLTADGEFEDLSLCLIVEN